MKKLLGISSAVLASGLVLSARGGGGGETATTEGGLPAQMARSTYGTGTSTYEDTAAVAEALTSGEGATIRIVPSDAAPAQRTPLRGHQAMFSRTGDAYIYSCEADYVFAAEDWRPPDGHVPWAPTAPHSLLGSADSGIETPADVEGKQGP